MVLFFFFLEFTAVCVFFFFSSRRRHTRWTGDWSSDVCSSDLADIAMYEAKKQGKGQHQVFLPGMDLAAWKRLELEAELRAALEDGQFELYYQPILDLD